MSATLPAQPPATTQPRPVVMTDEGWRIHRAGLLIDGHNDLPWQLRTQSDSSFDKLDIAMPQDTLQTDIPRLRQGGVGAQFWVVYVPPETARSGTATSMALEQFDLIHRMVEHYSDTFELARTAEDVERIHGEGKIAALIGVEGGHAIENSLVTLDKFYDLGARYMGLTHSETIDWADSATDEPRHGGLSPFGEQVVREMNRLGMLVDLAHVSADTMRDVLRVSTAPVIASHSSAYAVAQHARNVPDDVLKMIARNGGVVMVCFFSGYIHPDGARAMANYFEQERALQAQYPDKQEFDRAWQQWRADHPIPAGTVHTLVDHIDHIVRVAGIDHVGLGADYEGARKWPAQLEDVSGYPYITQELLNRGYSERDIHKIMGANLLRALRQAEQVARYWQYDLLIHGGNVIDGTGAPGRPADVLIQDGRIVRLGQFDATKVGARRVVDATGMVVTPGFIDTHAHGDPLETPELENFLAMGVTTVCLGQDGESPADLGKWMKSVEQAQPGPNIATFVGHGTVRNLAGVGLQRDPSTDQIEAMQQLVRQAMAQGCLGLTTGLEYQPGSFANVDELIALAKPVAHAGGLVMSHMRSEDDDAIEAALAELIAQGRGGGCPVHVSHIKVVYGHGPQRAAQVLAQMQAPRASGVPVTADIYPYTASYTGIGIVFPDWAKPPHDYADVVRNRRAELADYLRRRVTLRNGPQATLLGTGPWAGQTLAQVAAELGKPFEDVLIDDIELDGASAAYFVMDAELQERLLIDPHVMICSDGSPTARHPRGHGAFARVIRKFVIERQLLSLEEAVHKMTGLSAATVGLDRLRRGRLAEGYAADVLIFDPQRVRDNATYEQPHELATGFDWVVINGRIAREKGNATGVRAGRLLRRARMSLAAKIDALCHEFDRPDVPGASVAVIRAGKIVLARSYGLADLDSRTAADAHTNYRLASMSKQFTAMCIMLLKERGLLSYDDPLTRFFPDFPAIGRQITVRQLLGHTSGLVDYEDIIPPDQTAQLKDRDVLDLLKTQHGTYFTPGTQYRYSNTGYALLALIVENVSGTDFATFLAQNIFEPLGMTATVAYERDISTVSHRAYGYRQTDDGFLDADQSLTSAVLGDGGIYTSLTDYYCWDQALYGSALLSPETLEQAFTPGRLSDGTPTGYGFGWRIEQRAGQRVVHHNGETSGFNSAVRRVPKQQITVVVLTNRAGQHAALIADELLDWLLADLQVPPQQ